MQVDLMIASKRKNMKCENLKPIQNFDSETDDVGLNESKNNCSKIVIPQGEIHYDYINTFEECLKTVNFILDTIEASLLVEKENREKNELHENNKGKSECSTNAKYDPFDRFICQSKSKKNQSNKNFLKNTKLHKNQIEQGSISKTQEATKIEPNLKRKIVDNLNLTQDGLSYKINIIPYLDDTIESRILQSIEKIFIRQMIKYFDDALSFKFQCKIDELSLESVQYSLNKFQKNNKIDLSKAQINASIEFCWLIFLEYLFLSINFLFNLGWDALEIYDIFVSKYGSFIEGKCTFFFAD